MEYKLKYFGTDGIRGKFGGDIINEKFAFSLGVAFGYFLEKKFSDKSQPVLLARDTRPSGNNLLLNCIAGLQKKNFRAINLGVLPTPTLAFSVVHQKAIGGVMVTASHNPHHDNGLKIISNFGGKLSVEDEHLIESFIKKSEFSESKDDNFIPDNTKYIKSYINNLSRWFEPNFLKGMKIVIDLANGATKEVSPLVLKTFGAEVICMNSGEGLINDQVGSEFTEGLSQKVLDEKADLGLAHDGDGDRIIFVDKNGVKIHGDKILGVLATSGKVYDRLKPKGFIATIHSNSGLEHIARKKGIDFHRSDVGDRNVFALMQDRGINWGGESSGHIICSNYLNTGDGIFSALSVLKLIAASKSDISSLAKKIPLWPSKSIALPVKSKTPISSFEKLQDYLKEIDSSHKEKVRSLIRYSGTEDKIRILVEAQQELLLNIVFSKIKNLISEYI